MKKKILSLVLVFALALALGIGGTVAWLTAKTEEVVNTFTVGDINIDLTETGTDEYGKKSYEVVPGGTYAKDPTITIKEDSESCYVFVTVDVQNNGSDNQTYVKWAVREGWTLFKQVGTKYFYYYNTKVSNAPQTLYVLAGTGDGEFKNGYVTVDGGNVTKEYSDAIENKSVAAPKLTFMAYAVQSENLKDGDTIITEINDSTAAKIWAYIAPTNS